LRSQLKQKTMSKQEEHIPEAAKEKSSKITDANETGVVLAGEVLPTSLPIMPIRPRPLFPGILIPLAIRENQLPVVEWALESGANTLGLVLARDVEKEDSPENLHRVGVAGRILKAIQEDEGNAHILISCLERFTIQEVKETSEGLFARVKYHYAPELSANQELKAYSMAIISTLKELVSLNPLQAEAIRLFLNRSSLDVSRLCGKSNHSER